MTPDSELLASFARTHSEAVFAELVQRHINLVYSAALRQLNGDAHLAQDVAQTVFTDLALKATSLVRRETLTGWLYTSAHFAAAKIVRGENRRRDREEQFMREPTNESAPTDEWEKIRPALDAAMHELKETDREAILLRYFENLPFIQVGAKLGLNENAARMRVERALEKLRAVFAKRGIAATSTLAAAISANAVQLAPVGFSATLTTASIAAAGTGTFTFLKIMTATKLKLGVSALVVASAATALVVQHQAQEKLRDENGLLQHQIAQLQTDNESFFNRLATASDAKKLPDDQFNELLKLRGEVGVLRRQVESQKAQIIQQSVAMKETRRAPDSFVSKDRLANAGFDTPEAALQTYFQGFFSGNYDQVVRAMSVQIPQDELNSPKEQEEFEKAAQAAAADFQGIQMLAKKIVNDNRVDLEVLVFQLGKGPDMTIQHMVREGSQWRFAGSASPATSWNNDGQVQTIIPSAIQ